MAKLISVIVPVYNIESYINQCMDSIINQKYKDFEVIIVDDGSTDSTGKICDDYAVKDDRISVVHINNSGVSNARNIGINLARGEYLVFVDGDDYLGTNYLDGLVEHIESSGADFLINLGYNEVNCISNRIVTHNSVEIYNDIYVNDKIKLLEILCLDSAFSWAPWCWLIKRQVILEKELSFSQDYVRGEDMDFFLKLLALDIKMSVCKIGAYYYRIGRQGSAMNDINYTKFMNELVIKSKYYYTYKDKSDIIARRFQEAFLGKLLEIIKIKDKAEVKKICGFVKENYQIYQTVTNSNLCKLHTFFMKIFGIYKGSMITSWVLYIRLKL